MRLECREWRVESGDWRLESGDLLVPYVAGISRYGVPASGRSAGVRLRKGRAASGKRKTCRRRGAEQRRRIREAHGEAETQKSSASPTAKERRVGQPEDDGGSAGATFS
eukprot:2304061-Rhodomonas_salina.1